MAAQESEERTNPFNSYQMKNYIILGSILLAGGLASCAGHKRAASSADYDLGPMPTVHKPLPEGSVAMGDVKAFEEVKLDLPITEGPYQPTWSSIEANYPGTPQWLRDAKFGIWVHFGPQSAGESGDWYARRLYNQGTWAYNNHLKKYGHPSEVGYKEVLRDWNPEKFDPEHLVELYKDAGARFFIIQGVHHDQYDMWDSKYQPWNSTKVGPRRDFLREWQSASRKAGMRFGITFHHEYSWWWWQTAFQSDREGDKAGVPYDGNLTLEDGKGKWWEGLDPRYLYGVNLREYDNVPAAANTDWSPPRPGIFSGHLDFAEWYAKWWALRMMDAIEKYEPDFIYTDGTDQQPFSGSGTGTGYKCDAMQRVMADFYNRTLARKGEVDAFSIVKFRDATNGTVNTCETAIPADIKTDQAWIAETPIGDWFYAPDFVYSPDAVIRYMLEIVSRDGVFGLCIPIAPDGSLDEACVKMLADVGEWMRVNGDGIYGSAAWKVLGEGEGGKLNVLPGGRIGAHQANHRFRTSDFRFTMGRDGALYAWCMTVPEAGERLKIASLADGKGLLEKKVTRVELMGTDAELDWKQTPEGLEIVYPSSASLKTAVGFKVVCD